MKHSSRLLKILLLSIACLSCNALTMAQTTLSSAEASSLEKIKQAIREGKWAEAENMVVPLVRADPANPFTAFDLAQVYENTNRVGQAKNIYAAIAAIPEAERSKYVLITNTDNKGTQTLTLLSDLARNKVNAIDAAALAAAASVAPVAAKAAEPAPPPVVAAKAPAPAPQILALDHWLQVWTSKDLKAYFDSYVKNFKGDKATSAAWKKFREANITGKSKIEVKASDVQLKALDDKNVQLNFTQAYTSNSFTDTAQKTLVMTNVDGRWLISKETTK